MFMMSIRLLKSCQASLKIRYPSRQELKETHEIATVSRRERRNDIGEESCPDRRQVAAKIIDTFHLLPCTYLALIDLTYML